ncbi:TIGR00366 family protein [Crassaminicella profunda]|nr:TIGR00366 family protein [Crassaminicella profunda]
MPHIFIILFTFLAVMAVLTYVIPAGEYDRIAGPSGRMMIDPNSYHVIDSNPINLLQFFVAIPKGFVEAAWVIVLTFCVGGGFVVVKKTGIIEVTVQNLAHKLADKGIIIIPVLMCTFAIIDAFIGMPELCMVYVPIIVPLALALGFDSITAAAIALCGSAAGFTAALTNPFTVGIGQKIAGLPLYSGVKYRIVVLVVMLTIGILFVLRYARKVKANPTLSSMYQEDLIKKEQLKKDGNVVRKATTRQKLGGLSAGLLFIVLVFGVFKFKWDMPEIGAMFIVIGAVSGMVSGLKGKEICDAFIEGCHDVLVGALIVGLARGITVIMDQGMIIDTIIHGLSAGVKGLPSAITSVGMLVVQTLFNFLMPSGSGQTLITMPIMAPLADIVGVTRQTAVLALQIGDGFSNVFYPTSGYFMASLALAGVAWQKWAKFMLPLFLIWSAAGAAFLIIAQAIKWGPF